MDFGIYIHFPFCATKCPYCDFHSTAGGSIPHDVYAQAVLTEARLRAPELFARPRARAVSVYLGGGTPSLWHPRAVKVLLSGLAVTFDLDLARLEVTLEANPGSLTADRLAGYAEAGVNRVSLGVQALDDASLRLLGRSHDAAQARQALNLLKQSGLSFCADALLGFAGDTWPRLRACLDELCGFAPGHLSLYELTCYQGTPLAARPNPLAPEELRADLLVAAWQRLAEQGYRHYEVSNFALPGCESRHNGLYWRGCGYLGLGAAAHGFLQGGPGLARLRYENRTGAETWQRCVEAGVTPEAKRYYVSDIEHFEERVMLGLRLADGFDLALAAREAGLKENDLPRGMAGRIGSLAASGLLTRRGTVVAPTDRGLMLADRLAVELLS